MNRGEGFGAEVELLGDLRPVGCHMGRRVPERREFSAQGFSSIGCSAHFKAKLPCCSRLPTTSEPQLPHLSKGATGSPLRFPQEVGGAFWDPTAPCVSWVRPCLSTSVNCALTSLHLLLTPPHRTFLMLFQPDLAVEVP